ncbi:IGPD-domain-containing protein [Piedraia hortae CBS 480.64]|uniref:Imidazoleglycerol-phosphate dehydratase n=1 Tax=Piedraia hortae CBS 480.64 TaxID=1314780 RepID=A0A6A7C3S4_9PEZI|nr:IGPD-domain-containing protein [Piedraia hortae CBS 480.64]
MTTPPRRTSQISRSTHETRVTIYLSLDGGVIPSTYTPSPSAHHAIQTSPTQNIDIDTGIGFLDHMLHALSKHAGWTLYARTQGDLQIDDHHSAEDSFLALGQAFKSALGDAKGLARFGDAKAPLDEALSEAVVDLSNRPFAVIDLGLKREKLGDLSTEMIPHCLHSFAMAAGITIHMRNLYGENDHHKAESAFKALALALRKACARVKGKEGEIGSTKGVLF